jgi:glycosyltransferase involved in cell wall biosynthesis
MQAATLYITPSLHEGFGLTVLEAMACGIPVIAANRTSLPEVVGDAGMLVEPREPELAAAMSEMIGDADLRSDYRARGLSRAACYSWDTTARLTLDVYRHVLGME